MIESGNVTIMNSRDLLPRVQRKHNGKSQNDEFFEKTFESVDTRLDELKKESIAYVRQRNKVDAELERNAAIKAEDEELIGNANELSNSDIKELTKSPGIKKNIILGKSRRN